jgi:hypothetical protein
MRAINVEVGKTYLVKVSGNIVPVRLDRTVDFLFDHRHVWRAGGWWGTNLTTGHAVRIKSAARLRCPATNPAAQGGK